MNRAGLILRGIRRDAILDRILKYSLSLDLHPTERIFWLVINATITPNNLLRGFGGIRGDS